MKRSLFQTVSTVLTLIRYNLKIMFVHRFLYFLLAAVGFFVVVVAINRAAGKELTPAAMYNLLLLPAILLVFYPAVFGIQSDADAQMLEVIFGIPDYRYRIWLFRLALSYAVTEAVVVCLCFACAAFVPNFPVLSMALNLFFAILFWGGAAFLCSTLMRNAYGAAVVLVMAGFLFWTMSGSFPLSQWNVFLNPFSMVSGVAEATWHATVRTNRFLLFAAGVLSVLWGLRYLMQREKFL